ncbi:MAG: hypothetical protein C0597_06320 [Marinilabiliales bacterium]|nr:MAG: hypothetical protein C0597_06320 [Marinilabiliales bacterium]
MNLLKNYIDQKFSDELKLIIYLTQEELKSSLQIDLSSVDWGEFLELVVKHRLTSHILKHSTFLAEHIPIPVYEKLIDVRLEHSKKALNFAIHAIRIHQQFKENKIEHCLFKGPLLSLHLYNDIGYRNFKDIDVLVNKADAEKAKEIIEELNFNCIYPKINFSKKQQKVNYSISHHYHFVHSIQKINVELHWNMTNPKSFLGIETNDILINKQNLKVSTYELPYISKIENLVFQAAHGSIHQWYRLFWLKDFSVLLLKSSQEELQSAYELSKKLKLDKSFIQACKLSGLMYNVKELSIFDCNIKSGLLKTPLNSISTTDLGQKGIAGKLKFVFYRLRLKRNFKYYLNLIFRLRTHLTDWEIIRLNDSFFFLYYFLRPFLLVYKFLFKK